ncbi:Cholesterol 7-alpha-monooxygenase [Cytospora mali]|uniref:Cholesterol 7-alpha-monooxygenase n=1 Tax=Cytospora mali TaxID=578113 RepID=A0A194VUY6_CYTMA|nr:Cholesterol 7-alpha-monooxygenase [Valsa mali]
MDTLFASSNSMISILATVFTGILAAYVLLRTLLNLTQDVKEPPAIGSAIPFISPAIDLWRKGSNYWKGPQSISFVPVTVRMHSTLMKLSPPTNQMISKDALENNGAVFGTPKVFHPTLSPGPQLNTLNRKSVQVIAASLSKFATSGSSMINLFEWVSLQVLAATTESVYGPQNPFRDPAIVAIRLKYEAGIIPLMVDVLPRLSARPYVQAREALVQSFVRYYQEEGPKSPEASPLIQAHYKVHSSAGIPLEDIARLDVAISVAIISNAMPASFWLIYHIFSDPVVLEDCRKELSGGVKTQDGIHRIDIDYVKNRCPIFVSTFQETFRIHSTSVVSCVVLEDHLLNGQYLLKKGGIVLIPASVQHRLEAAWGPDVDKFYHKRFLRETRGKRYNPVAFRAFGGGSTLCPGRHFAAIEILAFAALITLRFDARPPNGL